MASASHSGAWSMAAPVVMAWVTTGLWLAPSTALYENESAPSAPGSAEYVRSVKVPVAGLSVPLDGPVTITWPSVKKPSGLVQSMLRSHERPERTEIGAGVEHSGPSATCRT